ncbi:MAG: type II toxin-antitoxin system Phd/YefM family antitoxin [Actinobacteria bacterium]|nr:type II toxin-antitoxin system Phd/YefM family antitoxin [Actinomycetota bacterium]
MTSVGIRELRQHASDLIRRVEAGETVEITDRGRPVAVLAPLPDPGPTGRMRVSGDLVPAEAPFDDLAEPLRLERGQESPSSVLARLRADER